MSSKTKVVEKNGSAKSDSSKTVWVRAFTGSSEWPDKVS